METKPQILLLIDDDPEVTEALAAALEQEGRTILLCHDMESAQLVVDRIPVDLILSDVRLTLPFGYEGLGFLQYAARHAPHARIVLMSGIQSDELRTEAASRGAIAFLQKPFDIDSVELILGRQAVA